MAKGRKTGGRQKGTRNKSTSEAAAYVDRVEAYLRRNKKPLQNLVAVGAALLFGKDSARVFELLMAYRYGKPMQPIEASGPGGGPVHWTYDIPAGLIARKGKQ